MGICVFLVRCLLFECACCSTWWVVVWHSDLFLACRLVFRVMILFFVILFHVTFCLCWHLFVMFRCLCVYISQHVYIFKFIVCFCSEAFIYFPTFCFVLACEWFSWRVDLHVLRFVLFVIIFTLCCLFSAMLLFSPNVSCFLLACCFSVWRLDVVFEALINFQTCLYVAKFAWMNWWMNKWTDGWMNDWWPSTNDHLFLISETPSMHFTEFLLKTYRCHLSAKKTFSQGVHVWWFCQPVLSICLAHDLLIFLATAFGRGGSMKKRKFWTLPSGARQCVHGLEISEVCSAVATILGGIEIVDRDNL